MLGRSWIDVIDNRFDRLNEFATTHLLDIFRTRLQSPTRHEGLAFHTLLVVRVACVAVREIADARVEVTFHHRLLGQKNEADIQAKSSFSCATCCRHSVCATAVERLYCANFRVQGERLDVLDVAHLIDLTLQGEAVLHGFGQPDSWIVLVEELIYLNLIEVVLVTLHLERPDDGVLIADCDGSVDVFRRVGNIDEEPCTKQELIVRSKLEIDGLLVNLLTTELSDACRS